MPDLFKLAVALLVRDMSEFLALVKLAALRPGRISPPRIIPAF
jgi:hypothetical protein